MTSEPVANVCAFTCVCEEDAYWLAQYFAEAGRVGLRFAMHLDRCSPETKKLVRAQPLCVGTTSQNDPRIEFNEKHKQNVHDLVMRYKFKWSMSWDVDETFETDARLKLEELLSWAEWGCNLHVTTVVTPLLTLWDHWGLLRTDGPFGTGRRSRFNRLNCPHKFRNKEVNGPTRMSTKHKPTGGVERPYDLVTLHWGMLTEKLRLQHKERWDRIYTTAIGYNPYGIWDWSLDPAHPPVLEPHDYLSHLPPDYKAPCL